jgi:hypothetical protein
MTTETRRLIGEIREYLADLERKLDRRRLEAGLDNLEPLTEEEEAWVRSANASADKLAAGMAAGLGVPDVVNWRGDVQGRTFAILDGVEVEVTDPEPRELAPRDGASPTIAERNQAAQDEAHRIRSETGWAPDACSNCGIPIAEHPNVEQCERNQLAQDLELARREAWVEGYQAARPWVRSEDAEAARRRLEAGR